MGGLGHFCEYDDRITMKTFFDLLVFLGYIHRVNRHPFICQTPFKRPRSYCIKVAVNVTMDMFFKIDSLLYTYGKRPSINGGIFIRRKILLNLLKQKISRSYVGKEYVNPRIGRNAIVSDPTREDSQIV